MTLDGAVIGVAAAFTLAVKRLARVSFWVLLAWTAVLDARMKV